MNVATPPRYHTRFSHESTKSASVELDADDMSPSSVTYALVLAEVAGAPYAFCKRTVPLTCYLLISRSVHTKVLQRRWHKTDELKRFA